MSLGPGRIQRVILGLIAAEPDGVWTTDQLCRLAYPGVNRVEKKHRVAVLHALRKLALPGEWMTRRRRRPGCEHCLYDPCSDEAQAHVGWLESTWGDSFEVWKTSPHRIERAREKAAEARRWRDASPVEKLDMEIGRLQTAMGFIGMALQNGGDTRECRADIEKFLAEIAALKAERDRLSPPQGSRRQQPAATPDLKGLGQGRRQRPQHLPPHPICPPAASRASTAASRAIMTSTKRNTASATSGGKSGTGPSAAR
jgi:hypothetical protein